MFREKESISFLLHVWFHIAILGWPLFSWISWAARKSRCKSAQQCTLFFENLRMEVFLLWILSLLEYYGTRGREVAIQKRLTHTSLMSAALSLSPGCWQGLQAWSELLAGLVAVGVSTCGSTAAARAVKLLTRCKRQRIAQPMKYATVVTYFHL